MNWFTNLFKSTNTIKVSEKVGELRKNYYDSEITKLKNKESININIPVDVDAKLVGDIKTMSYDENKNIVITMVLDTDTARKILLNSIEDKIRKDTTLLEIFVSENKTDRSKIGLLKNENEDKLDDLYNNQKAS